MINILDTIQYPQYVTLKSHVQNFVIGMIILASNGLSTVTIVTTRIKRKFQPIIIINVSTKKQADNSFVVHIWHVQVNT